MEGLARPRLGEPAAAARGERELDARAGGGARDGGRPPARTLLLEEAVSPSNFLVFAKPSLKEMRRKVPLAKGAAGLHKGRATKVGGQLNMCRGTAGTPDGCLLCRLRQSMSFEAAAPRAARPDGPAQFRRVSATTPSSPTQAIRLQPGAAPAPSAAAELPSPGSSPSGAGPAWEGARAAGAAAPIEGGGPVWRRGITPPLGGPLPQPAVSSAAPLSAEPQGGVPEEERRWGGATHQMHRTRSRMARMGALEAADGARDRVSTQDSRELAQESFLRRFQSRAGGPFHEQRVLEALADFGLRAHTRAERVALDAVLARYRLQGTIEFPGFLRLVEECRGAMRQAFTRTLFDAWKYVDVEDAAVVSRAQAQQVLEDLDLLPGRSTEETESIEACLMDVSWDSNGQADFFEIETLVLQVRELRDAQSRRVERDLWSRFEIEEPPGPKEARPRLTELYEAFGEVDDEQTGVLDNEETLDLLADCGCLRGSGDRRKAEAVLQDVQGEGGGNHVEFNDFVEVVLRMRELDRLEHKPAVEHVFREYDQDDAGKLDIHFLCPLLVDLDMLPRMQQQQVGLAKFVDEVAAESTGYFGLDGAVALVQLVVERLSAIQRRQELARGLALGFSRRQVYQLRRFFDAREEEGTALWNAEEVEQAARAMGWRYTRANIDRLLEEGGPRAPGTMALEEFLALMRRVQEEFAAEAPPPPREREEVRSDASPSNHARRLSSMKSMDDSVSAQGSGGGHAGARGLVTHRATLNLEAAPYSSGRGGAADALGSGGSPRSRAKGSIAQPPSFAVPSGDGTPKARPGGKRLADDFGTL